MWLFFGKIIFFLCTRPYDEWWDIKNNKRWEENVKCDYKEKKKFDRHCMRRRCLLAEALEDWQRMEKYEEEGKDFKW